MFPVAARRRIRPEALPRLVLWSTFVLLLAGIVCGFAWRYTGNAAWIQIYFTYPGAVFFIACSLLAAWVAYLCWSEFAPGDLLRPAWFLILLSAVAQVVGGLVTHIFGHESRLNPFWYLPPEAARTTIDAAQEIGRMASPVYMVFLGWGLLYVIRACRRNGILAKLKPVDYPQLVIVFVYTLYWLGTVVATGQAWQPVSVFHRIAWLSDPLLCLLLFEVILIRRSTANMGWGLISRCWTAFAVSVFLTSLGDIGLWGFYSGRLPYPLVVASWYIWFLASAAYALGPIYQLQAMRRATCGQLRPAAAPARGTEPSWTRI